MMRSDSYRSEANRYLKSELTRGSICTGLSQTSTSSLPI